MLERFTAAIRPFGPLPLRLGVGLSGILHGIPKLEDPKAFTAIVATTGLPWPEATAWAGIGVELVAGLLLLLGFHTRLAALAYGIMMGVAVTRVHLEAGYFATQRGFELPLLLGLACLALAIGGPGRASIDAFRGKA